VRTATFTGTEQAEALPARLPERARTEFWRSLAHEPLVHFLLLGALIFAASAIVSKRRDDSARRIIIDQSVVRHLVTLYAAQMGAVPSRGQLDAMINEYIREEMQFREAKRLGLDADDEIIRRRLASKFDFLHRDLATVADPSAEEVRRFYESHATDFTQPATVSFTHIYFSPDRGGDQAAHTRAGQALRTLQSEHATRAPNFGDRFPLQTDYAGMARLDLTQQFGDTPIVESLLSSPVNQWSGPVRSGYGWHLFYISHRDETRVPPLKDIQDAVKAAYVDAAKARANQEQYDALAKQYTVERTYLR
jgi:hypothetical protein